MRDNKLVLSLVSTILAFASSILLGFILTPILINDLGIEAYSFYPLTNNLIQFISVIIFSISSTSSRHIKLSFTNNGKLSPKIYFSSAFYLITLISVVILLVFIPISLNINNIITVPLLLVEDVKVLFFLTIVSITLRFFSSSFGSIFYIDERLYLRAISEIMMNSIKIISLFFLFFFFESSIIFIGITNFLMSLTLFSFNFYFYFKEKNNYSLSLSLINIDVIKKILTSGLWITVSQLGMLLIYTSSITITNLTLGVEKSSFISIYTFFPLFLQSFSSIISNVFIPRIIRILSLNDRFAVRKEVMQIFYFNILFLIPFFLVFYSLSSSFYQLWTPSVLSRSFLLYSNITLFYSFFIVFFLPLSQVLIARDKLFVPAIISLIIGFVSTSFIYLFMRYSDYDLLVSPLILFVATIIYFLVFLPIYSFWNNRFIIKDLYNLLFFTIIGLLISFFLIDLTNLSEYSSTNWLSFIISAIMCYFLSFLILSFLLFIISKKRNFFQLKL